MTAVLATPPVEALAFRTTKLEIVDRAPILGGKAQLLQLDEVVDL